MKQILLTIAILGSLQLAAQDLHFSQNHFQPLYQNPAATAVFTGKYRAAAIHRAQWRTVPVNFQTTGASFDAKALARGTYNIGVGLLVQRDEAGDAALSWTQIGLSAAVAHALGESQAVSVGVSAGMAQRTFDISNLKFKNQWNGELFDASLPSKEAFQNSSKFRPTLAAGANYHFQKRGSRNQLDFGFAVSHLNRPVVSFRDDVAAKLPMRLTAGGLGYAQMSARQDLVAFANFSKMAKNQAVLLGAGYRFWLSNLTGRMVGLQLTGAFRLDDAIIPAVQIEFNGWTVGASYDLNISDFSVATGRRGGFELGALYRFVPVPPPSAFKVCPIF